MKLPENLDEYVENSTAYEYVLSRPQLWNKVPMLNYAHTDNLKCEQLVRFRGMVQDMANMEMYVDMGQMVKKDEPDSPNNRMQSFRYRESLTLQPDEYFNHGANVNRWCDRRPITLISVPALNSWVCDYEINTNNCMEFSDMPENNPNIQDNHSPIKERPSKVCIIKLYSDFEKYPICSVVDVLGYLFKLDGYQMHPVIHAIAVHELSHCNPMVDMHLSMPEQIDEMTELPFTVSVHGELLKFLSICMLNDDLAANYMLCHLLSSIFSRADNLPIGKFCLNIYNLPKTSVLQIYTQELYNLLQMLLPASHYYPMSLENLNTSKLSPDKNYDEDVIRAGMLQLAPHTHLVLDETAMQPGELGQTGIHNVTALKNLIREQTVRCDFQYYQIEYPVDIPVLILSEGRTLLESDFILPLDADVNCLPFIKETLAAARHYLQSEQRLDKFRKYLTLTIATSAFEISTEAAQIIENDYAEMRQKGAIENHTELNDLIVLVRFLGLAKCKLTWDVDTWNSAKKFEAERKARIERMRKTAPTNSSV